MRTSIIKSVGALALTAAGTAFVFGFRTSDNLVGTTTADAGTTTSSTTTGSTAAPTTNGSTTSGSSSTSSGTSGTTSATASAAPAATAETSTSAYADGTFTGAAVSEPWGAFQVAVVIDNGAITNVTIVESPSDGHSTRINNQAVPLLTESTLASQGSTVDTVSGATWTSRSYSTSLQSALDEAANAA